MKAKQKLITAAMAAAMVTMLPFSAFAAVKIGIYGESRIYGVDTVFNKYITLKSTGYGLVRNHASLKITLVNGKFAKDGKGNYMPVYLTDSKKELTREEIETGLADGSLKGMAFLPTEDDYVRVVVPENMIDKYAQIMFSASAAEYGNVGLTISNNRDIDFIVEENTAWDDAEDPEEETPVHEKHKAKITVGSNVIYAGDKEIKADVPAFIGYDGYVKIPLRAVSEIFGSEIYWNGAEKTITIYNGEDKTVMTVNDKRMFVNDYATPLNSAPEISDGRTFIPIRDLEKIFDIENLEWDTATRTATFDYYLD